MTPLELGGLDSVLANQLNNQTIQNTQTSQPRTAPQSQGDQNTTNTQNLQDEKSIDYSNTSRDNLEKQIQAIEQLTKNLSYLNTHLNITLDKKADSLVIKIIDNKTNQVIKEIPPEYMLRIAEAINNLVGIIVSKKV